MGHKKYKAKVLKRCKKLMYVSTDKLLYELTTRSGIFELGVNPYGGGYIITHLYHDDPERILDADRVLVINPRYRHKSD